MKVNIVAIAVGYLLMILWGVFLSILHKKGYLSRKNFAGKTAFISYGLIAYPAILLGIVMLYSLGNTELSSMLNYVVILSVMWAGGVIDDLFGSREITGFGGHVAALVKHKRITTGMFKIICGIIAGCAAAMYFNSASVFKGICAFLLIPLSANTINLFDLRPGRAFAVFFICSIVILAGCSFRIYDWNICGIIFAVALIAYFWDRTGDAMMGDSFSNVLGAFLGILVIMNLPLWFSVLCIVINLLVQLYSEKHSITELIERVAFLRFVDKLTGTRR